PGTNREWCLSRVLAKYEITERQIAKDPKELRLAWSTNRSGVDFRFTDALPRTFWSADDRRVVTMPAWIKQKVRLLNDWSGQVRALRRPTRQEISRFLRKYGYDCSLTSESREYKNFYEKLYLPYVTQRFGSAAHVVDAASFYQECSRGVLLRLTQDERLVGAALLRPIGRTMAVV